MTFANTIDKTRKDIEKAISDKSPLLVLAGASDFAAERLRAARAEIVTRTANFDPKSLRDQAQSTIAALPEVAEDAVTTVVTSALTAYGDLSERGRELVGRVRGQQATSDLKRQASSTTSKAKAATTTAKKSSAETASAAKKSTKSTTKTAKKSAARTKTSAKAASTSAKKTATSAKKAAGATASKVGD